MSVKSKAGYKLLTNRAKFKDALCVAPTCSRVVGLGHAPGEMTDVSWGTASHV